ncbi:lysophospholipase I [Pluteus cervinus]|uniref:Lysophospholipase I n=1 Tax=Pluteus cervinus TaxID=181527 RepID=A0ACD3B209_9AGAR|nr:lysophospholipase I [Pluteus cervinus]
MAADNGQLNALTLPPKATHSATVFFVHGLGDTGYGWKPVADLLRNDPGLDHVKWILPHSPKRQVQANMGIEMPSFDIYSFGFETDEDETGMLQSARLIDELIAEEVKSGMDPTRIVLGGFSQGAAMSLLTGLTGDRRLAGVVALSGWLPLKHKFKTLTSKHAPSIPVFWGHGKIDPLVKMQHVETSAENLVKELGMPKASSPTEAKGLSWNLYDNVGHATCTEELDQMKEWIKNAIPALPPTT